MNFELPKLAEEQLRQLANPWANNPDSEAAIQIELWHCLAVGIRVRQAEQASLKELGHEQATA